MFDCEQLQTPLLVSPVALIKLHRRARSRVAWTEFGSVGVGRRAALGQNDKSSEGSGHPGVDPVSATPAPLAPNANAIKGNRRARDHESVGESREYTYSKGLYRTVPYTAGHRALPTLRCEEAED